MYKPLKRSDVEIMCSRSPGLWEYSAFDKRVRPMQWCFTLTANAKEPHSTIEAIIRAYIREQNAKPAFEVAKD